MKKKNNLERPDPELLRQEISRMNEQSRFHRMLRSTIYTLIVVAAAAILVATLWIPVLEIYGASMTPTLNQGEYVLAVKGSSLEQGDLVAFYIGNKILVKRCTAGDHIRKRRHRYADRDCVCTDLYAGNAEGT